MDAQYPVASVFEAHPLGVVEEFHSGLFRFLCQFLGELAGVAGFILFRVGGTTGWQWV